MFPACWRSGASRATGRSLTAVRQRQGQGAGSARAHLTGVPPRLPAVSQSKDDRDIKGDAAASNVATHISPTKAQIR